MATILDIKPIDRVTVKDSKSEMLMFFGIMREKKEYEMLRAMKDLGDAKYRIKSFKRQIKEIEKNIEKLKAGKRIPIPQPQSIPIPPAIEEAKPIPIPPATETAKVALIPLITEEIVKPSPNLHSYYYEVKNYSSTATKPGLFLNRSVNDIPDRQVYNHNWKCEKCSEKFGNRKLLKHHISENHSY